MIYKFHSKAAADLVMTGPVGDRVLGLIGKTPGPQGIIEPGDMARAIRALEEGVAAERPGGAGEAGAEDASRPAGRAGPADADDPVSLRQRAWPMLEMLKRAQAAGEPIVWGV